MRRWTCPNCETGILAPERPRRDDVRRYCLPCSQQTGRLVARSCPAVEKARAAQTERTRTKAAARRKQETAAARKERDRQQARAQATSERAERAKQERRTYQGWDMIAEAERIWPLMAEYHHGKHIPTIDLRHSTRGGTTGRAWPWRIVITAGGPLHEALWVLIHELAHAAVNTRGENHGHDTVWADCYVKAARARWGTEHFTGIRAARGYAVDNYVAPAVARALAATT